MAKKKNHRAENLQIADHMLRYLESGRELKPETLQNYEEKATQMLETKRRDKVIKSIKWNYKIASIEEVYRTAKGEISEKTVEKLKRIIEIIKELQK